MEKRASSESAFTQPPPAAALGDLPVRDGEEALPESLAALRACEFPASDWELIVVDDGGAPIVPLWRHAREPTWSCASLNRAVRRLRATGEWSGPVAGFSCSSTPTSASIQMCFAASRMSSSSDRTSPPSSAPTTMHPGRRADPQYRNLLHRYVHVSSAGEAETFWTGCGAIRREAFAAAGGFDETIHQLEDVELGYRARALGYCILLRPEIQGTHLKRWTLLSMARTDLFGRGIGWMRILLRHRHLSRRQTLNLQPQEVLYTVLTTAGAGALAAAAVFRGTGWLWASAACLLGVLAGNVPLLRWMARERGVSFALRVIPLRLLLLRTQCRRRPGRVVPVRFRAS